MSEESQPQPAPAPAAKRGRGKLIAAIVVIVVLVVAGAVVAVTYLNHPAPCTPAAVITSSAGSTPTIKVGFSISLTGTFNVEGTNSLRGINAMANWINANGGVVVGGKRYNITLDYYDDQSQSTQIQPLYAKIVQTDGAQFLIAPYSSGLTSAAAPFADQYNEVMLSHGGAADTIFQKGYKNIVEVLSPASKYLDSAVDWLAANHSGDKLGFLYASDAFSALAAQSAITYARSKGFQVVYNASYGGSVNDLSSQVAAAQAQGADDLLGGGHYADGLLIMNGLKSAGWNPKFVSLLVAVTEPAFQQQLTSQANGITGPSQWETSVSYSPALAQTDGLDWVGPTPAQFTSLYGSMNCGAVPSYHSAEAGATLLTLATAIHNADSLNTTAVRTELGNMHIMDYFGEFQVDSTGLQIAHTMVLDQWQAGSLKVVYPSSVAVASVQYPYTGS